MKDKKLLEKIDAKLKEWIPYVLSLQRDNGAFPWGYRKVEHEENVDTTVCAILPLSEYDDEKVKPVIGKGINYLLEQQRIGRARLNPWLECREEPGIAALVTEALAKLYDPNSPEVLEELNFIDQKIGHDGKPQLPGNYRMQSELDASLKILRAYCASGKKNSEKAIKVRDFVFKQQREDGHLNINVKWKDWKYKLYATLTGDPELELTGRFLYSFIVDLHHPLDSKEMSSAAEYVSKKRFSRITMTRAPASILSTTTALLLAKPDYELGKNLLSQVYGALNIPIGLNIEQDIGRTGWGIRLRNKLRERY